MELFYYHWCGQIMFKLLRKLARSSRGLLEGKLRSDQVVGSLGKLSRHFDLYLLVEVRSLHFTTAMR